MQKEPLSEELFLLLAKLVPRVAVELVIQGKIPGQFLLTKRGEKEPFWPGLWHIPGGYIWHREPIKHAINRIAKRELGVSIKEFEFLGYLEFYTKKEDPRGHTISLVFLSTLDGKPSKGTFFTKKTIPDRFLQSHHKIVNLLK